MMQASTNESGSCRPKSALPAAKALVGVDVEAGVLFDAIQEVDSRVVAAVGRETVERFRENVVEDDCLREGSAVDTTDNPERRVV
jgi:hypothetical protein